MRVLCTALAVLSFACTQVERLPPGPGNNLPPGGIGTPGDAGPGNGNGGDGQITGRLCRIIDLRDPTACVQLADMSDITVRVRGGASVASARNGTFTLDVGAARTVVLEAAFNEPGFRPTVLLLGEQDGFAGVLVPVVDAAYFGNLVDVLAVPLPDETGTLAIYTSFGEQPLDGIVIENVSFSGGIFYDAGGPLDWLEASVTGLAGVALVFGVLPPVSQLTAADVVDGSAIIDVDNIPVAADAITFVSVPFD